MKNAPSSPRQKRRVARTQPVRVNPGNRHESLMQALGELVFPMVLADSGGDTATGSAPHGMPVDAGALTLTLENLTVRLAWSAGAHSTITQVANPLARDIAVADGVSCSLPPQRRRNWKRATAPMAVPVRILPWHRGPSASRLERDDVAADRQLRRHHQQEPTVSLIPTSGPFASSFIAALAACIGETTVTTPRMRGGRIHLELVYPD